MALKKRKKKGYKNNGLSKWSTLAPKPWQYYGEITETGKIWIMHIIAILLRNKT